MGNPQEEKEGEFWGEFGEWRESAGKLQKQELSTPSRLRPRRRRMYPDSPQEVPQLFRAIQKGIPSSSPYPTSVT